MSVDLARARELDEIDDAAPGVERVSWDDHYAAMAQRWHPGEHVSIICQTGGGKTYLFTHGLLPLIESEQVIIFDSKGDDPELIGLHARRISKLPNRIEKRMHGDKPGAHVYMYMALNQADTRSLIDRAYQEGHITLVFDEIRALTDKTPNLGLAAQIDGLWMRGRSREVTIIAETQAPRWVPAAFYEQARHLYIGALLDTRAQQRLAEIGGDTDAIQDAVETLALYEFLYIGPLQEDGTRIMEIVKVPNG